tara:strand:+ start:211 stop:471 length:261 start_codon:yes stop_codon:yes gene_type:complete
VELMYIWIILWLACIVGATIIGSRKKIAVSACFYGLIFGPLGVVLVFISKGKKITCPFCKKLNYITSLACIHCNKKLSDINKQKQA